MSARPETSLSYWCFSFPAGETSSRAMHGWELARLGQDMITLALLARVSVVVLGRPLAGTSAFASTVA